VIPHLPGLTPRPEAEIRPGLEEGLALYRAGFFWEAHEAWEPLWLAAAPNSRERAFLQGLIQLANGWLKLRMGRAPAAGRIAALAREHLGRAGQGAVLGIDTAWARGELVRLEVRVIPVPVGNETKSA
jgi:uncharacterized protein